MCLVCLGPTSVTQEKNKNEKKVAERVRRKERNERKKEKTRETMSKHPQNSNLLCKTILS